MADHRSVLRRAREGRGSETLIARVDQQLFTALGILNINETGIGQLTLARVNEADCDHLVQLAQTQQGFFPAGSAEKVRDDDDKRAAANQLSRRTQQFAEISARLPPTGRSSSSTTARTCERP